MHSLAPFPSPGHPTPDNCLHVPDTAVTHFEDTSSHSLDFVPRPCHPRPHLFASGSPSLVLPPLPCGLGCAECSAPVPQFPVVCGRIPLVPGQGVLAGVPRAADSVSPMSLLQTDGQERTPPCPCPLLPPQPAVLTESVSASPGPLHLPRRTCPIGVPQAWGPVWGLSCAQRVRPPPRALSHFPRTSGGPGAC